LLEIRNPQSEIRNQEAVMRKPVTYVNIALLVAAVWLAAGTRSEWRGNHGRYAQFAAPVPAVTPAAALPAGGNPAASYAEVVDGNLFSPDRNNSQPSLQKKAAPPLPVVVGTMNLGSGKVALMADQKMAAERTFRRVKEGDEIGGYRVVEIADHKVVLEFGGEKSSVDVYESAASVADTTAYAPPTPSAGPQVISAAPPVVAAAPAAASPAGTSAAASAKQGMVLPQDPNDPFKTCVVEGNRIKCTRKTPFGPQIWYEQLR
jgi:hypothetical protein